MVLKTSKMPSSLHSEPYRIFIALLRETREGLNVSQAALALKLEQPQTFVSKCETGIRRVDVVELNAWLRALNADLPQFVEGLTKRLDAHSDRTRISRAISRES